MIQILNSEKENLISAKLSGKISKSNVEMENFDGYTIKGFWEDIKTDASHLSDYGKMAFVGENKWQEWVAKVTDFFTSSDVKYFDLKDKEVAKTWIEK